MATLQIWVSACQLKRITHLTHQVYKCRHRCPGGKYPRFHSCKRPHTLARTSHLDSLEEETHISFSTFSREEHALHTMLTTYELHTGHHWRPIHSDTRSVRPLRCRRRLAQVDWCRSGDRFVDIPDPRFRPDRAHGTGHRCCRGDSLIDRSRGNRDGGPDSRILEVENEEMLAILLIPESLGLFIKVNM